MVGRTACRIGLGRPSLWLHLGSAEPGWGQPPGAVLPDTQVQGTSPCRRGERAQPLGVS